MTKHDEILSVCRRYDDVHEGAPATAREIAEWGVAQSMIAPPKVDPMAILAQDFATAMREDYRTDPGTGRRYRGRHPVRITADGVQFGFWADMKYATRAHMQNSFAQRRKGVVGDCIQLKTDVDVYNGTFRRADEEAIQMVLDFTDDVAEAQALDAIKTAA